MEEAKEMLRPQIMTRLIASIGYVIVIILLLTISKEKMVEYSPFILGGLKNFVSSLWIFFATPLCISLFCILLLIRKKVSWMSLVIMLFSAIGYLLFYYISGMAEISATSYNFDVYFLLKKILGEKSFLFSLFIMQVVFFMIHLGIYVGLLFYLFKRSVKEYYWIPEVLSDNWPPVSFKKSPFNK
jgi:hypothetical protein